MIYRLLATALAPALLFTGCAAPLAGGPPLDDPLAVSEGRAAVSSADPRATAAGEAILRQGGSASDAAIAVMLALTVVEPQSSGIGGGGFMLHAAPDGTMLTIDGRETAPVAAGPDWFLDGEGEPLPFREAVRSGLSVGVPGNIALAAEAHERFGRLEWPALFAPAIALARDGFRINPRLHRSLTDSTNRAAADLMGRAMFYDEAGEPLPVGTLVRNPALADTLERIAREGPEAFYGPEAAQGLAAHVWAQTPRAGAMVAGDITSYTARERRAVCGTYREYRICGMGPPSSGGVAVLQMLGQLERFDLAALGPESPIVWHLFLESQRLAYADRELYLADSDFLSVPVSGLVDPAYLARRSQLIDPATTIGEALPGRPAGAPQALVDGDEPVEHGTSHFSVVDGAGNLVSYTSTIEGVFGSGLMWGGFYLNNELTDFSFSPERDGQAVANRVEPAKRPRSSMAPTIVYAPDGEPVLVVGAAGGATIPVQVTRAIIGVIDFGLPAQEAAALPLIMQYGQRAIIERGSALVDLEEQLQALGHDEIVEADLPLKLNALHRVGGIWISVVDPRLIPQLQID